jgi:hypothetical protein
MTPVLPDLHQDFLTRLIAAMREDTRFIALLGCGSMIHGGFDIWSDLDFTVVVEEADYADVMATRETFAASLGGLLSAFTGEHVGESRLLICLYGQPLLHVDFKFLRLLDLRHLVEKPIILWSDRPIEHVLESPGQTGHRNGSKPVSGSGCTMGQPNGGVGNGSKPSACWPSCVSRFWGRCWRAGQGKFNVASGGSNSWAI